MKEKSTVTPDLLRILLIGLHVIVSLFLILVVLLQTGKGASLGAAFGVLRCRWRVQHLS